MHNVYNKSDLFYLYDLEKCEEIFIGNEKDLILLIAKAYRSWWDWNIDYTVFSLSKPLNTYLNNFICSSNDVSHGRWVFYDGYNRVINPMNYHQEAYELYNRKFRQEQKTKKFWDKRYYRTYYKNNKTYKGTFRCGPVEGIRKHRGGPYCKKPTNYFHYIREWSNPEYQGYNRGDKPKSWDYYTSSCRRNERNWKSQRKTQWK